MFLVDRVSVPVDFFFEDHWSFKVFIDIFGVCLISFTFAQYLLDLNQPVNIVLEENNVHLWPSVIIDFVHTYSVMIFAYSWKFKLPEIYAELSLDTRYQQYRYLGGALTGIVSTSLTLESGDNGFTSIVNHANRRNMMCLPTEVRK